MTEFSEAKEPEWLKRDTLLERPLPHSAEAERAIEGSVLLNNGLMHEAAAEMEPEDFYVHAHHFVWDAMLSLYNRGSEIDPLLIAEELRREGKLEAAGGMTFISELTYGLPHYPNVASYAKVVKDHALMRQLIKVASKITDEALESEDGADVVLDRAGQYLLSLMDRRQVKRFSQAGVLVNRALVKAAERAQKGQVVTGVSTGLRELDSLTLGLQPTDLIIVAARPGMGKTSLAMTMAEYAAVDMGLTVGVFSLEMSEEQLSERMVCSRAHVDAHRFRSGYLSRDEWARLAAAEAEFEGKHLYIDDSAGVSPLYIRSRARRLALQAEQDGRKLDVIVVDYLQLMSAAARRAEQRTRDMNREQEVSSISRELKGLAKELNVPLVALAQLSRAPEQRSDHRPVLSDLRESGSIEQDADLVAFIYREEQYRKTEENTNLAELILAKNRNGATGTIQLSFLKEFTRFENMGRD
jgi:replicative DNA helicase